MSTIRCFLQLSLTLLIAACGPGGEANKPAISGGSDGGDAAERLNPMITLHEGDRSLFGLYAPSIRPRGRLNASSPVKSPSDRAEEVLGFGMSDYVFDGSMEGGVERGSPPFLSSEMRCGGGADASSHPFCCEDGQAGE